MAVEKLGNFDNHPAVQVAIQVARTAFFRKNPLHGLKIAECVARMAWTAAQETTTLAVKATDFVFSPPRKDRQEQEDIFDKLAAMRMAGGE